MTELCEVLGVDTKDLVTEVVAYRTRADVIGIIECGIVLIICAVLLWLIARKLRKAEENDLFCIPAFVISAVIGVIALLILYVNVSDLMALKQAPTAYAIKFILGR